MRPSRERHWLPCIVTALLLVTTAGHMFFVVPGYRRFLEGLGVAPSLPSRLAIAASRFGLLMFAAVFLGIGAGFWWKWKGRAALLSAVLSVAALLTTLYLALVTWVYWDVARVMERIG